MASTKRDNKENSNTEPMVWGSCYLCNEVIGVDEKFVSDPLSVKLGQLSFFHKLCWTELRKTHPPSGYLKD